MKHPAIEPLEQRIAPANANPTAVTISDAQVSPSTGGSTTMVFFLSLDHPVPAGDEVLVHYSTVDGTAISTGVAPDYLPLGDTVLKFAAGQQTQSVVVTVNGTGAYGPNEQFNLNLASAALDDSSGNPILSGGNPVLLQLNPGTLSHQAGVGTGTIHYSNALPTVAFSSVTAPETVEGNASEFTVALSAAQDYDVTIHYSTMDGTGANGAHAGTDFTGVTSGVFTIPKGSLSTTIDIATTDLNGASGDTPGTDKVFSVQLVNANLNVPNDPSNATNLTSSPSLATGEIKDVGIGHFQLSATNVTVDEGQGTMTFTVTRTDNTGVAASVDYATTDGTATSPTYYTGTNGTLHFAAGDSSMTITIPIIDNHLYGGSEAFGLTLSNAQNAAMSPSQDPHATGTIPATVTISNDDVGPSHFSVASTSVNENAGTLNFIVSRTGDLTGAATVTYTTADGTAKAGTDYTMEAGTLSFAANQGQALISIPIADLQKTSGSAQFTVSLTGSTGADITASFATVTINDNDVAPNHFATSSVTVNEAAGTATVTVTRTGDTSGAASVSYSMADGTATDGVDYSKSSNVLHFNANDTSETITIPILDPQKTSGTSQFSVNLANPLNADITTGQGTAVVTINDNDPAPSHIALVGDGSGALTVVNVNEAAGTATFTLSRTGDTSGSATVHYTTADGTAVAGTDYAAASGVVTFAAGAPNATFTLPLLDPQKTGGGTVQFTVSLSSPTNSDIVTGQSSGTVIITDNDQHANFVSIAGTGSTTTVTVDDVSGTAGSVIGMATFTVNRTGDTTQAATVDYATVDGTAIAGTNYTATTGTLHFAAGDKQETITVPILAQPYTGNEQFTINLTNAQHTGISAGTGTVIIDGPSHFALAGDGTTTTVTVDDKTGGNTATFTINRTGDLSGTATVHYFTADGSGSGAAVSGTNYTATSGSLEFDPGVAQMTVSIPILPTAYAGNLQFSLNLDNAQDADISPGLGAGTVVIDAPSHFAISSTSVNESAGTATLTVTRTGDTTTAASVAYATADGTAKTAVDYVTEGGTLNFAAGATTMQVTVPILDAHKFGLDENFTVQLMGPQGADIAANGGTGTITIHENDTLNSHFAFSQTGPITINESAGTETFLVTRTGATSGTATVTYATVDGTALAGTDYTAESGTLTFGPGVVHQDVTVPITNFNHHADSQFTMVLNTAQNADFTVAGGTATTIIHDDAAYPTVSVNSTSVTKTLTGTTSETFTVTLSSPDNTDAITVNVSTADGTATASGAHPDYTALNGYLVTIPAGSTTATFTVPVASNDVVHTGGPATFTVHLSNATTVNANPTALTFPTGGDVGTGTINDAVTESATINNVTVNEGGDEIFTVTLAHPDANPVTITYASVDGTAKAGADYIAAGPTMITFAPYQTTATIDVATLDPGTVGPDVNFTVNLSAPSTGVTLTKTSGTGTIHNVHSNDLTIDSPTTPEGADEIFTITLAQASATPVTVNFTTMDGTDANAAHAGTDYAAQSGTVTIPANQTTATIDITTLNSGFAGPDTDFTIQLSNPSSGIFIATPAGTGTIHNTDTPTAVINNVQVVQGAQQTYAVFTVTVSHALANQVITIPYMTVDGSATSTGAHADYTAESNTLTFAASSDTTDPVTETIMVPILGSTSKAATSQFTVQLGTPTNAIIGTGTGTGTILNNNPNYILDVANQTMAVGAPGTQAVETFTVTLSQALTTTVTVNYATADGTGPGGATSTGALPDYVATSGTLTFAPGVTQMTIPVTLLSVGAEPTKTFSMQLSNPVDTGNSGVVSDVAVDNGGIGTGTITNTNTLPGLGIGNVTVAQNGGMAVFTVELSEAATSNVNFSYQTLDGTAHSSGQHPDFTKKLGSGTIAAGATSTTISIPINDLGINEGNTNFSVDLFAPSSNAVIADAVGQATITHGNASNVAFTVSNAQDVGSNNALQFTVTLSAAATSAVTFTATPYQLFGLGSQTAIAGSDFSSSAIAVTIPAGTTSATFSVPIAQTGNGSFQPDRSFGVGFSQISSNAISQTTAAIGTVLDTGVTVLPHEAIWHDVDGDTVTLKVSKGNLQTLTSNEFQLVTSGTMGGRLLQELDLSAHNGEFAHANVSVVAQPVTLLGTKTVIGDGHVNVGYIAGNDNPTAVLQTSNAEDLGVVTVDGDLARIDVGDLFNTPGLIRLNVLSLGVNPNSISGGTLSTILAGGVSSVNITGDLAGQLQVLGQQFGTIGSLKIGGSLTGRVFFSGTLEKAVIGNVDGSGTSGGGIVDGLGATGGSIGSLKVLGGVFGGAEANSGFIQAAKIRSVSVGKVVGGAGQNSGEITSLTNIDSIVAGQLIGGNVISGGTDSNGTAQTANDSGAIVATGSIGSVTVGGLAAGTGPQSGSIVAGVSIGKATIRGSIDGTGSAASAVTAISQGNTALGNTSSGEIISDGSIGSVHVFGNLIGGGFDRSGDILALGVGGIGSVVIDGSMLGGAGVNTAEVESHGAINSLSVAGNVTGGGATDSGEINALSGIGSVSIGGSLIGGQAQQAGSIITTGQIGKLQIGQALPAGAGANAIVGGSAANTGWITAGSIGHAEIHGNITGAAGVSSGQVRALSALGSITIDGTLAGGGGANSGEVLGSSSIGSIVVKGGVTGGAGASSGTIQSSGAVNQATLGAADTSVSPVYGLTGGSGAQSGVLQAVSVKNALVYGILGGTGSFSGGFSVTGALGSINIQGNLQGGDSTAATPSTAAAPATNETGFISAASIGSVIVSGNVTAGTDKGAGLTNSGLIDATGAIKSVLIHGTFGAAGAAETMITAGGQTFNAVALGNVEIDGNITNAEILAGNSTNTGGATSMSASASIGAILIKSAAVSGLHIAAGASAGTDGHFGTMDDTAITKTGQDQLLSRIASVIFTQEINSSAAGDSIEAPTVSLVKMGTSAPIVNPGLFSVAAEVGGLPGVIAFTLPT